jgi:integrase/recombinase XerD
MSDQSLVLSGGRLALMPADQARATFDAWLMGQRSKNTRRSYAVDFGQWRKWLTLADLTLDEAGQLGPLVAYREYLKANGYSNSTIARKLSTVRMALDAAQAAGILAHHAAKQLKSYRVPSESPRHALADGDVRAILSQPDRSTRRGLRDYALLLLVLTLGARVTEAASITLGDIARDREHTVVTLREAKGDKPRTLPLPPRLLDALAAYVRHDGRLEEGETLEQLAKRAGADPLFRPEGGGAGLAGRDRCISSRTLLRVVVRHSARAGVRVDTHTLRHTAATKALETSHDLARVSAMLGHSDPKTTMRYLSRLEALDESPVYGVRYDG